MMAVPVPLRPVITFLHQEEEFYVGAFRQNSLLRLEKGFKADFIFKALPGKTFQGEVIGVLPAIGESQIQAQGTLVGTDALRHQGRPLVTLRITDDMSQYNLPVVRVLKLRFIPIALSMSLLCVKSLFG